MQEKDVCSKLCIEPQYQFYSEVPSEAKLKEIKSYLRKLNTEKVIFRILHKLVFLYFFLQISHNANFQETRYSIYVKTIEEIDELLNDLEISIVSNFEQMALDKNNEFQLSDKNMSALQVRKDKE